MKISPENGEDLRKTEQNDGTVERKEKSSCLFLMKKANTIWQITVATKKKSLSLANRKFSLKLLQPNIDK